MYYHQQRIQPRIPDQCYSHSAIQYVVQPGDTMYMIASRFGFSISDLMYLNYHIHDYSVIFPGDVICIPKKKPYCTMLNPRTNRYKNILGTVVARKDGINVIANLPPLQELGSGFKQYVAFFISPNDSSMTYLDLVTEDPRTYLGSVQQRNLTAQTQILVSALKDVSYGSLNAPGDLILLSSP